MWMLLSADFARKTTYLNLANCIPIGQNLSQIQFNSLYILSKIVWG